MFDWDDANTAHIAEHDVTRAEAEQVINNDPFDIPPVQARHGELRFVQLGETDAGRVLFVVVTERGPLLRVVTAYDANRTGRRFYALQRSMEYGEDIGTAGLRE